MNRIDEAVDAAIWELTVDSDNPDTPQFVADLERVAQLLQQHADRLKGD